MMVHRVSDGEMLGSFMVSQYDGLIYPGYAIFRAEFRNTNKVFVMVINPYTYRLMLFWLDFSSLSTGTLTLPISPI